MLVKIYFLIWALGLFAAGALYLTGNFNQITSIVFGFLTLSAVFLGMVGVLPSTVGHHSPSKH